MLEIYLYELDLCCLFMFFMRPITSLFFSLLIINFYDKDNIIALLELFSKLGKKNYKFIFYIPFMNKIQ